jgi:hypothetical protein
MTTRYRREGAAAPGRTRLPWITIAGLLVLLGLLGVATPLQAQQRISIADLRCLTNKQEDCLPEPMSEAEPHRAICATCHNVWTQKTPAEAARTCAASDCHVRPDTLTPFHRGLSVQVRRNCIGCHPAHDVRIPDGGTNCTFCHTTGGRATAASQGSRKPSRIVMVGRTPAQDRLFRHEKHNRVECTSCHTSQDRHGSVSMTRVRDCQSCHHPGQRLTTSNCQSCHVVTREAAVPRRASLRGGSGPAGLPGRGQR